jgi:hypothetical protein
MPATLVAGALQVSGWTEPWFAGRRWMIAAAAVGVVPLLLLAPFGTSAHQSLSAFLLFVLVLGAVAARRTREAVATLLIAFACHCVLAIAFARLWPQLASACFPGGADYWTKNLRWIRTGEDPEYLLGNWVPAHVQLALAMLALGFLSLGLIPMLQGFHEVDLMNYYVGQLLSVSGDAPTSLLLGWHPWSWVRGLAYGVMVGVTARYSFDRLVGRPPCFPSRGLAVGCGLLLLDGLVKLASLDPVRTHLAANLTGG